jgi:hypothetical protein
MFSVFVQYTGQTYPVFILNKRCFFLNPPPDLLVEQKTPDLSQTAGTPFPSALYPYSAPSVQCFLYLNGYLNAVIFCPVGGHIVTDTVLT